MDERSLPWLQAPLQMLRDHQRGHALLLHGGPGSGLFELALRVAGAWLCEAPPGPCAQCAACRLIAAGTHPDLTVLIPESVSAAIGAAMGDDGDSNADGEPKSRRKPSREIKVDAVRSAIDQAHTSPARSRGKVLVVHPAEALNAVAANALLKTLEEPPASVRWLLCTSDPDRLLPTLRSRCQHIRIAPPNTEDALLWLTAQGVEGADVLLAAAGGEPLSAQSLAADGMTAALWTALPKLAAAGDAAPFAALPLPQAIAVLQRICHDVMADAAGAAPRFFPAASLPQIAATLAGWQRLAAWSKTLLAAAGSDEHPWNAALRVESLVLQGRDALLAPVPAKAPGKAPGYTREMARGAPN